MTLAYIMITIPFVLGIIAMIIHIKLFEKECTNEFTDKVVKYFSYLEPCMPAKVAFCKLLNFIKKLPEKSSPRSMELLHEFDITFNDGTTIKYTPLLDAKNSTLSGPNPYGAINIPNIYDITLGSRRVKFCCPGGCEDMIGCRYASSLQVDKQIRSIKYSDETFNKLLEYHGIDKNHWKN